MGRERLPILRFEEGYFERIWGGQKLESFYGKPIPAAKPIGEAWIVADHAAHESRVDGGPCAGKTLGQLLEADAPGLLGTCAKATVHGRFPLLLKILDAHDVLSVQAHPDDACAERLGEPDVGKTEMWHVLDAEPGSELICGLDPGAGGEAFAAAVRNGSLEDLMVRFAVTEGDSVFVPAGTVHAIGRGILLAEIQQELDISNPGTVHRVLSSLERKEYISKVKNVARGIRLTRMGAEVCAQNRQLSLELKALHQFENP